MMINEKKENSTNSENETPSSSSTATSTANGSSGSPLEVVATPVTQIEAKEYEFNTSNNSVSGSTNVDHCDLSGLEIVNSVCSYPKKVPIRDDDCDAKFSAQLAQLPKLSGEYEQFIGLSGKSNNDVLIITNFRLFFLTHDANSFINVPLKLIEAIEVKEILFIYIYLKIVKTIRLTFNSSEKTLLWASRLNSILNYSPKLEDLFAFPFYSWYKDENNTDDFNGISAVTSASSAAILPSDQQQPKYLFARSDQTNLILKEYKRLKFDSKWWRVSEVNKKFEVCPTYPDYLIVPKSINDEQLKKIAAFRSSKRFPSIVWRSKKNGAVIARSSQPNVGLWARRLEEDELLLRVIADTATSSSHSSSSSTTTSSTVSSTTAAASLSTNQSESNSMLLIIDARFSTVALANRVKGGGYEYSEYYTNCEIQFMNLENIHVIRSSFQSLRLICQLNNDNRTVLSQLENSKWLHHISGIMKAAYTVTSSIDQGGKSVLIHCSDGWDRTPQILALAKLLLDPFYRTINGFRILIEVEWLMFGHKFAQRNGHSVNHNDVNERCPVFLQWLDCVYQVTRQFPSAFQFNEIFLLKLCYHSYSCLFGTFLCDSAIERVSGETEKRTFSVWSYLNEKNIQIVNHLYDDSFDEVLYPAYEIINLQLWQKLFCEPELTYLVKVGNPQEAAAISSSPTSSFATTAAVTGTTPNFNDSLDGIGTSPLEQQIKQIIQDDLEIDMKLNNHHHHQQQQIQMMENSSSSSSSIAPLNSAPGTITAITGNSELPMNSSSLTRLTSSAIAPTSNLITSPSSSSSSATNGSTTNPTRFKIRSYDDLSKLNSSSNKFKTDFDNNLDREYHYSNSSHNTNTTTTATTQQQQRLNNALTNEDVNTASSYFSSNGDPIPMRRCSEPTLLDAINSASPKLSNNSIIFNFSATTTTTATNGATPPTSSSSSSMIVKYNPRPVENGMEEENKTEQIEANNSDKSLLSPGVSEPPMVIRNEETSMGENENHMENKDEGMISAALGVGSASATTTTSLVHMQNSTDTLVDEALLSRKLAAAVIGRKADLLVTSSAMQQQRGANGTGCSAGGDGETSTGGTLSPAAAPDYTPEDDLSVTKAVVNHASSSSSSSSHQPLSVATNSSESSTSSTIPSPTMSSGLGATASIQTVDSSAAAPAGRPITSNSVSTSTSGLFDYVNHSPKYFHNFNDAFKLFPNNNCNYNNGGGGGGSTSSTDYLSEEFNLLKEHLNETDSVDECFADEISRPVISTTTTTMCNKQSTNGQNHNGNGYRQYQHSQPLQSGSNNNKSGGNNRVASSSIPIKSRNGQLQHTEANHHNKNKNGVGKTSSNVEQQRRKTKKNIRECIDHDGLTKVEDRTFRKIIERDEKYRKEIATLKDQLNRCKLFLNKLATNPAWQQETPNDLVTNELENSQSEENQSTCGGGGYSLSNDSFCSSWDEIDEADYKLANWVPDYCVTHCQGCNDKFSLRLRKHHCRKCGQVFCYKCADNFCPLPDMNLTAPVRVCRSCKTSIELQRPHQSTSSSQMHHNYHQLHAQYQLKPTNGQHQQQQQPRHMYHPSPMIFSSTPPQISSDFFAGYKSSSSSKMNSNNSNSTSSSSAVLMNTCNLQASADPNGNKYKNGGVNKNENKSQKVSV